MQCPRCSSRMLIEHPYKYSYLECSEASYSELWRCIMCGFYSDRVLRANRAVQQAETIAKQTPEKEAV